ncbi:Uncharacterised protein [[Clostridium] sordellii]|uniref:hypothetical protein n=1 Tax=Paraclostridium sordellii TaxID=1505 RepID=UPI0005E558DB|nr:hypothetical protein [Paeniclostridium sordellii]CEQ11104.1 Uncharacterised protein [[Clostridium] sordellii] [Paeniclostridium sordellii]
MLVYGGSALILEALLFMGLNKIFNVYYFGSYGVFATLMECVILYMFLMPFLLYIIANKWVLIIGGFIISKLID